MKERNRARTSIIIVTMWKNETLETTTALTSKCLCLCEHVALGLRRWTYRATSLAWSYVASMATLTAIARTTVGPAPRHKRRIPSSLTIRCSAWIEFLPDNKWFWETLNTAFYVCTTQSFSTLADRDLSDRDQQKSRVIFYDSFHNFPVCSLYLAT